MVTGASVLRGTGTATPVPSACEEDRVPVVRPLVGVAATRRCARPPMRSIQSIELAVAAEELGADGAFYRVHHFAQQLASPFPLLAAVGARTKRIEIGTAVIDMRYENPLYMAEDAGAADLIAGGRLQLGISRGSPEQVIDGFRYFGYVPAEGADRRRHGPPAHRGLPRGHPRRGLRRAQPAHRCSRTRRACSGSSRIRRVCGTGSGGAPARDATAEWAAQQGLNLMSSTLMTEDAGVPFHQSAGRADPALPRGVGSRRSPARAARVGQPEHLRHRRRPRSGVLRGRQPGPGPGRLSSMPRRGRSSAAPMPPSPTSS